MTNLKTISIVIPTYNEEKRLPATLQKWQNFLENFNSEYKIIEIIIVDDGSFDNTVSVAQYFEKSLPIKIAKIKNNLGKGNAVRTGIKKAIGDFVFIYDADAAVWPEEIEKFILEMKKTNSDIVIGSRATKNSKTKMSFKRRVIGKCFHIVCYPLLPKIKDASCGAKLFKTEVAKKIFELQKINRFAFDIEILWLAKKLNYKIKEIGVTWQEIPGSKIKIIKDSLEMFFSILGLYKTSILDKIKK